MERARASDTRARLARCEIYRLAALVLVKVGGACLFFIYGGECRKYCTRQDC